jgi:hypothetical protein
MELAGLEPATSWVRCGPDGRRSPVISGDFACSGTMTVRSREYACTRLVPAGRSCVIALLVAVRGLALAVAKPNGFSF